MSYENERKPVCRTNEEGPLDQRTEPVLVDVERQEGPGLALGIDVKVPSDGDVAEIVAVDVAGQKAERSWSHPGHFIFVFRESIV